MTGVGAVKPRGMEYNANHIPIADIGRVVEGLQHYMPYETAQRLLHERAESLARSGEYPGGKIRVKGDLVLLTEMQFSGGEESLCGIEPRGDGYMIVDYPPNLTNHSYN